MGFQYRRKAHYHETDQMGIIHHSNYIKWFEEARIAMMGDLGLPYSKMEGEGIMSPVLSITIDYLSMVKFEDEVIVNVNIKTYTGIRFEVEYEVTNQSGEVIHARGWSKHCFIDKDNKLVRLKKAKPEMHQLLSDAFNK